MPVAQDAVQAAKLITLCFDGVHVGQLDLGDDEFAELTFRDKSLNLNEPVFEQLPDVGVVGVCGSGCGLTPIDDEAIVLELE